MDAPPCLVIWVQELVTAELIRSILDGRALEVQGTACVLAVTSDGLLAEAAKNAARRAGVRVARAAAR